jgi:hypothetical protein
MIGKVKQIVGVGLTIPCDALRESDSGAGAAFHFAFA